MLLRRSVNISKPQPKPEIRLTRERRAVRWLGRGKLWDDVFTRTLAGILTITIIALVASAIGLIDFARQDWANVWTLVAVPGWAYLAGMLARIAMGKLAQRYPRGFFAKRQRTIGFVLFIALIPLGVLGIKYVDGLIGG